MFFLVSGPIALYLMLWWVLYHVFYALFAIAWWTIKLCFRIVTFPVRLLMRKRDRQAQIDAAATTALSTL